MKAALSMVTLVGCIFLSACSKNVEVQETETTLKILYWDKEIYQNRFGDLYNSTYPNVKLEFISMQPILDGNTTEEKNQNYIKLIQATNPDVMLIPDLGLYNQLIDQGLVDSLEFYIKKNKFDIENVNPNVLDLLKKDELLFGLSPTFNNSAIFYNKDIFNKYQIDYPSENLTWYELGELLLKLSVKMNTSTDFALFTDYFSSGPANLITFIGNTEGLQYINGKTKEVTINSDGWKNVYNLAVRLYKDEHAVYQQNNISDTDESNKFIDGNAAITYGGPDLIYKLETSKNKMNWGIIPTPVSSFDRNVSQTIFITDIFSINKESNKKDVAWSFIEFLSGKKLAKFKSKSSYDLYSRTDVQLSSKNGINLDAFKKNKTNRSSADNDLTSIPVSFFREMYSIQNNTLDQIINNKLTVEEGLDDIQSAAEKLIVK